MNAWWTRRMTKLLFFASWQLGLNWAVILPGADDRITGVLFATSKEAYERHYAEWLKARQG